MAGTHAARVPQARCTVCDGTSDETVFRENGYEGRACRCGTIYMTPQPSPEDIDASRVLHEGTFYDWPAALKARWVRNHTTGHDLLEIGCGTGAFLEAARARGFRVEGIEADADRATAAARRVHADVRPQFFEEVEPQPRFDVVYHCDMLAHFHRPAEALRHMQRFLRPGGVLAFEVGFVADLPRFWYSWIGEIGYPEHRWLYSQRSLRRLLHDVGLRVEHIKIFDLSACVATNRALRTAARTLRPFRPRRPAPPATSGENDDAHGGNRALCRLQNILRYRVGAWLPRVGPATALIIASPVGDVRDESIRISDRRRAG
jgi:SAM-dependent methyltransferase